MIPNSGCGIELPSVAASVSPDAATYPQCLSSTKYGTTAGTSPWYRSSIAWASAHSRMRRQAVGAPVSERRCVMVMPASLQRDRMSRPPVN
ncbi:MAG TPA: hypothetical protein VMI73_22580 [Trebonia sp.]|nr:hypothetical protein [Trebonia sp.]